MGQEPPIQPPTEPPAQPAGVPPATPAGAPVGPGGRPLAEWWKRLVASLIDGAIIGIPANIIGGIVFSSLFAASTPEFNPVTGQIESAGFIAGILASYGAFILMYWVATAAYYIYFHGSTGQTLGKKLMKIQVVDQNTGESIGYANAFKRWVIPIPIAFLTCFIGGIIDGLWPLFDPKRQAWHDKFANSLVVDVT